MKNLLFRFTFFLIISLNQTCFADNHQIALTIDDLPFVGESKNFHLNMIIDTLKANETPATGFIIAGNVTPNHWPTLRRFHDAGLGLGNHTRTHLNLNKVSAKTYIKEIDDADKILSPFLTEPKYFRYPYLAMSGGNKKEQILEFLAAKNYQVAPITIDSKDFMFNQILLSLPEKDRRGFLNALKMCYLSYIWEQTLQAEEVSRVAHKQNQPQILLIHANLLNAYVLTDIINLYRQNGYTFVSLEEALKPINTKSKPEIKHLKPPTTNIETFMMWD